MSFEDTLRNRKGVAGLEVFLSLVVMLFLIGVIVMVFALSGSELADATYESTSSSVANETVNLNSSGTQQLSTYGWRDVSCSGFSVINTTGEETATSGNYTTTSTCTIAGASGISSNWNNTDVYVSFSYTYNANSSASDVITDTYFALSDTTDWFDTFIVLGAMVVLILLLVIVITSIRGSGLVGVSEGSKSYKGGPSA